MGENCGDLGSGIVEDGGDSYPSGAVEVLIAVTSEHLRWRGCFKQSGIEVGTRYGDRSGVGGLQGEEAVGDIVGSQGVEVAGDAVGCEVGTVTGVHRTGGEGLKLGDVYALGGSGAGDKCEQ